MWAIIIIWIVFGLAVGLIAKALMANRHKSNLMMTIVLGIGGAILGGILSSFIFGFGSHAPRSAEDFTTPSVLLSIIFAVLGAIVLSAVFQIALNNKED